jgi:soluble lytic murein transglycosylase-like protein
MDLPPMPQPPSLEYVDNTVSPQAKALLYKHQTPERSIRGFAETREYEPSIVPGGFGPKIKEAADANGIPPAVLTALLEQESGFRPDVISGKTLSRSGAAGIAQFMPGTARQMGVDPLNTDSAIDGAARYLRHLMDSYGFDLKTAIYAYNAGPGTVQRYGIGATEENANYYPSIMKLATKYGYGQVSLNDPAIFRSSFATN